MIGCENGIQNSSRAHVSCDHSVIVTISVEVPNGTKHVFRSLRLRCSSDVIRNYSSHPDNSARRAKDLHEPHVHSLTCSFWLWNRHRWSKTTRKTLNDEEKNPAAIAGSASPLVLPRIWGEGELVYRNSLLIVILGSLKGRSGTIPEKVEKNQGK